MLDDTWSVKNILTLSSSGQVTVSAVVALGDDTGAFAAAVGSATGNFVAGGSLGSNDFAMAKVRLHGFGNGAVLWRKQWGTSSSDVLTGVERGTAGDLFVCGYTGGNLGISGYPAQGNLDFYVARLQDSNGAFLWQRQLGGGNADYATGIVWWSSTIHIAGFTISSEIDDGNSAGGFDFLVFRLTTAGTPSNFRRWGTTNRDRGLAVAATSLSGGVTGLAVVGHRETTGTHSGPRNFAMSIVRPNTANQPLDWVMYWGSGAGTMSDLSSVVITSDGQRVIAGGRTDGSLSGFTNPSPGSWDFVMVARRITDGALQWQRQWGTAADDMLGGLVRTVGAATSSGVLAIAFGSTGAALPGNTHVGGDDFVIVAARVSDGQLVSQRQFGTAGDDTTVPTSILALSSHTALLSPQGAGRLIMVGNSGDSMMVLDVERRVQPDITFLNDQASHPAGMTIASAQWRHEQLNINMMHAVAVSSDGTTVLAAGEVGTSHELNSAYGVYRFDVGAGAQYTASVSLSHTWSTSGHHPRVLALTADDAYAILLGVCGAGASSFRVCMFGMDVRVLPGNPPMVHMWSQFWGATDAPDRVNQVAFSPNNAHYFAVGRTEGNLYGGANQGSSDFILGRFSVTTGARSWHTQWGTPAADFASGVAISNDGTSLYVSGHTLGTLPNGHNAGGSDFVLFKLQASNGGMVWQAQWGSAGNDAAAYTSGLAITPDGAYLLMGGEVVQGSTRLFVVMKLLASNGGLVWEQAWGNGNLRALTIPSGQGMYVAVAGESSTSMGGTNRGGMDIVAAYLRISDGNLMFTRQWGTTSQDFGRGVAAAANTIYVAGCA